LHQGIFLFYYYLLNKILRNMILKFIFQTNGKEITKILIELIRNKLRLCPTRNSNSTVDDSLLGVNL
jgi:hypothetical protein